MKHAQVIVIALAVAILALSAWATVVDETGDPVPQGPTPGEIIGVSAGEQGVTSLRFLAESGQELTIFNGDPSVGENDLDQFGDLLMQSRASVDDVTLTVFGGNLVQVDLAVSSALVWCCYDGLCRKVSEEKCKKKNGKKFDSQAACQEAPGCA